MPTGRFVHDDEVGSKLFRQGNHFTFSAIQMGGEAGYLGRVADRLPINPAGPGRLGSAGRPAPWITTSS